MLTCIGLPAIDAFVPFPSSSYHFPSISSCPPPILVFMIIAGYCKSSKVCLFSMSIMTHESIVSYSIVQEEPDLGGRPQNFQAFPEKLRYQEYASFVRNVGNRWELSGNVWNCRKMLVSSVKETL